MGAAGVLPLALSGCRASGAGGGHAAASGAGAGQTGGSSRQRGVADPQPPHALLLAYDVEPVPRGTPAPARRLRLLLGQWQEAVRAAAGGQLTVTIAFGPRALVHLGGAVPPLLRQLPPFAREDLDPAAGEGDLLVQICGRTAAGCGAAGAAVEETARDVVRRRWKQHGFVPPSPPGAAPRNLLGFKDGTANPGAREAERWVWLTHGPYAGGCYLVLRRIRLHTDAFRALPLRRQEEIIGRRRDTGGPLEGGPEHQEVDLFAKTPEGRYILPADAHVRLAHSRYDGGARMLRRGYSYDNGPHDRGLLFLAYMNDPQLFVRVQRRLAAADSLTAYTETFASGVYFVPPADVLAAKARS
ncbi:Dyp-type peroxidase [Streptomyces sp. NPDC101132]|uniref:Dyp-type peroxidase n=1 Tax=Streptomyces sp. NPDC101132 TaxID=3366110 RepID=UPI0037FCA0F1